MLDNLGDFGGLFPKKENGNEDINIVEMLIEIITALFNFFKDVFNKIAPSEEA